MNQPRKHFRSFAVLLIIAFLLILGLTILNTDRPVTVKITRLRTGTVEEMVTASSVGSIEPVRRSTLSAEIQGKVEKILRREGAEVRKDEDLILLDRSDLMAEKDRILKEIDTTRLRIDQSRLRKEKIRQDMARLEPLRKNEIVSQQSYEGLEKELQIAEKEVDILTATLKQLESTLEQVRLRLDKTLVRAPFDSVVTRLLIEEGEIVGPGKMMMTLVDSARPLIEAPIDEVDLGKIKPGQEVRMSFDALPQKTFTGTLIEIAPVVNTDQKNNRTIRIKAQLSEWHPALRIGMSAKVFVITQPGKQARVLPRHVIYPEGYVLIIDRGVARKRFVKTGRENWDVVEILEDGMTERDEVILPIESEEDAPIREGMRVRSGS